MEYKNAHNIAKKMSKFACVFIGYNVIQVYYWCTISNLSNRLKL